MKCDGKDGKGCPKEPTWEHQWANNGYLRTCDEHKHCKNCVRIVNKSEHRNVQNGTSKMSE